MFYLDNNIYKLLIDYYFQIKAYPTPATKLQLSRKML